MDMFKSTVIRLGQRHPTLLRIMDRTLGKIPFVQRRIHAEFETMAAAFEAALKPYGDEFPTYPCIPEIGCSRQDVIHQMKRFSEAEGVRWQDGYVSGAVYHGDAAHIDFLNQVYAINSQSNPLHADLWPSTTKFEAEIVSMAAHMLGADIVGRDSDHPDEICGTVSSGGTESILLAIKTYRDWAKAAKGISKPEMVIPTTAHAAFEKAAQYFNVKLKRVPVAETFKADLDGTRAAITKNTIVLVGSAPAYPHGVIDPIEALSELALERGIGFHTDACLGGFVLPWAEKLGYEIPAVDFRLRGVTSISADTHKYGYAAKGTSVILYRSKALRRFQYYTTTEWPGGLYTSPTFAGSRPGGLSAACWAAMVSIGQQGYVAATKRILETAAFIKQGIKEIDELHVLGDPLWVIAFGSETVNIYRVLEFMAQQGWSLNGLHQPPAIHICVTLRHTEEGVAERFIADLQAAVAFVKQNPTATEGIAPFYGLAAALPKRRWVDEALKNYLDLLYRI